MGAGAEGAFLQLEKLGPEHGLESCGWLVTGHKVTPFGRFVLAMTIMVLLSPLWNWSPVKAQDEATPIADTPIPTVTRLTINCQGHVEIVFDPTTLLAGDKFFIAVYDGLKGLVSPIQLNIDPSQSSYSYDLTQIDLAQHANIHVDVAVTNGVQGLHFDSAPLDCTGSGQPTATSTPIDSGKGSGNGTGNGSSNGSGGSTGNGSGSSGNGSGNSSSGGGVVDSGGSGNGSSPNTNVSANETILTGTDQLPNTGVGPVDQSSSLLLLMGLMGLGGLAGLGYYLRPRLIGIRRP